MKTDHFQTIILLLILGLILSTYTGCKKQEVTLVEENVKSIVGVETPLGIIKEAAVAYGGKMRFGDRKVRPGHVFIILKIVAQREYGLVYILDWRLINSNGKEYPALGVMTDFETLLGAERLAAYGSIRSPKTNTFVYEVSETSEYVDFCIGNRTLGRIVFPKE
jgi:hypothetical protein